MASCATLCCASSGLGSGVCDLAFAPSHADRSSSATFQIGEVNFLQYTPRWRHLSLLPVAAGVWQRSRDRDWRSEQRDEQANRVVLGRGPDVLGRVAERQPIPPIRRAAVSLGWMLAVGGLCWPLGEAEDEEAS
jgi:hypothetical protein